MSLILFQPSIMQAQSSDDNIVFSTYLTGSLLDSGESVAVDTNGNIIVLGITESTDFPIQNAYEDTLPGAVNGILCSCDFFVSKFSSAGSLLWSTYLGGTGEEFILSAVAVDNIGDIYLTGTTTSTDFPMVGSYNSTADELTDVVVAKLSADGDLVWSTYFSGSGGDSSYGIAVDGNGDIIVTGGTSSNDFPLLDSYDEIHDEGRDAFLAKFSSSGSLVWSTFFGGNGSESAFDVSIDSSNNIYIVGHTDSDDLPLMNPFDDSIDLYGDAFIASFSSSGQLLWSTYLGGSDGDDLAWGITVDSTDAIVVTGETESDDFPMMAGNDSSNIGTDVFISKFSVSHELIWSTYLGESGSEVGRSIATDGSDNVYVFGDTTSSDFPVVNGYDDTYGAESIFTGDNFVSKYNAQGVLIWSSYFGGSYTEVSRDIAISGNNLVITGYTSSEDIPLKNAHQAESEGSLDAYLFKGSLEYISPVSSNPSEGSAEGNDSFVGFDLIQSFLLFSIILIPISRLRR